VKTGLAVLEAVGGVKRQNRQMQIEIQLRAKALNVRHHPCAPPVAVAESCIHWCRDVFGYARSAPVSGKAVAFSAWR
jgi:hypothetical protein